MLLYPLVFLSFALAPSPQSFGEWTTEPVLELHGSSRQLAAMAVLPDLTGDGLSEILIGAPNEGSPVVAGNGALYLHSGADHRLLLRVEGPHSGIGLGWSVAPAGDLDQDGVPDFLASSMSPVEVHAYSGATGSWIRSFVPPTVAGSFIRGFGSALLALPDLDGDGVGDILVGAPESEGPAGPDCGAVILYSGATGAVIRTSFGAAADDFLGRSLAPAGDLDHDGVPDSLSGATEAGPYSHSITTGRAVVLSGRTGAPILHLAPPSGARSFGAAVAGGVDVDGDGDADLLIGAPMNQSGLPNGTAFLYSGASGAMIRRFDGTLGDESGSAVAFAGDLTGNGGSEVLIGAPGIGEVRIYRTDGTLLHSVTATDPTGDFGAAIAAGARLDLDAAPDWLTLAPKQSGQGVAPGAVHPFSGATAHALGVIEGDTREAAAGSSLAAIDDWNGDGVGELAVGLPRATVGTVPGSGAVLILSGKDGSVLQTIDGVVRSGSFGAALTAMDDKDGDGIGDLLVGAPRSTGSGSLYWVGSAGGVASLFAAGSTADGDFGSSLDTIADLDGDGWRDHVVGAPRGYAAGPSAGAAYVISGADGSTLYSAYGASWEYLGYDVATSGDVDGDGTEDWLVGAPWTNLYAGRVDLYSGRTGQLIRSIQEPPTGVFLDRFGHSIAPLGDLDGDGAADFAVAAPGRKSGSDEWVGSVFVYSGATGQQLYRLDGEQEHQAFGWEIAGCEGLDQDGLPDLAIASVHWETGGKSTGRVDLVSGATGSSLAVVTSPALTSAFELALGPSHPPFPGGPDSVLVGTPSQNQDGGGVHRISLDPYLHLGISALSATTGGSAPLRLDFPSSEAHQLYAVLASATGAGPSTVAGIDVPLTQDRLFQLSGTPLAAAYLPGHQGRLDAAGDAALDLSFGPGVLALLIGRTLYLAAISGSDAQTGRLSSAARTIEVLP